MISPYALYLIILSYTENSGATKFQGCCLTVFAELRGDIRGNTVSDEAYITVVCST
jgi:hypothetical protein